MGIDTIFFLKGMTVHFLWRNKVYRCGALEEGRLNGSKIHTTTMLNICKLLDASNLDLATH